MKFRFWYMEYNVTNSKPSHRDLPRLYWQTESFAGEYDIPPAFAKPGFPVAGYPNWPLNKPTPGTTCTGTCPDGGDCDCVHTIHYKFTTGPMRLIYAGGHCHAPSCVSIELYRNDTVSHAVCHPVGCLLMGCVELAQCFDLSREKSSVASCRSTAPAAPTNGTKRAI